MMPARRWLLVVALAGGAVAWMLLAGIGSYSVEGLGNDVDERLAAMGPGDEMTYAELFDVSACDEVRYVGPYTPNDRKRELIGNARVDLSKTDRFAVLAAFEDGEVIRAVKISNWGPFDRTRSVPVSCEDILTR